jgi:hypothetical protein
MDKIKDTKEVSEGNSTNAKVFFYNGRLKITSKEIIQKKYDGFRKIYIDNIAGVTFVHSSLQRNMASLVFALGVIIAVLIEISNYNNLLLLAPLFICILAISLFFSSVDKIVIQSNASIMSISQPLRFKDSPQEILKAIDDAITYTRK